MSDLDQFIREYGGDDIPLLAAELQRLRAVAKAATDNAEENEWDAVERILPAIRDALAALEPGDLGE